MPHKKKKGAKHWEDEDERNGAPTLYLHEACTNGDVGAVNEFISKYGVSVELDAKGRKPLWYACSSGHTEIVELVLSHYPPSYSREFFQEVIVAAEGGHWKIVEILMEKGEVDVNMCFSLKEERTTLLALAAKQGNLQKVENLLKRGAFVPADNSSPLCTAALLGHFEICEVLLAKTDDTIKAHAADNAILHASSKGHAKIAKMLLDFVGDKQQIATKALAVAVEAMNSAETGRWKYKGGGILQRDLTPRDEEIGRLEVIKLMLDANAQPNVSIKNFLLPLHSAINNKNETIFELLLERGASVDSRDMAGNTPLMVAVRAGQVKMVRTLLEKGAKVSDSNYYDYQCPIHLACALPEPTASTVVSMLLEYGSEVNCIQEDSSTPLLIAVRNNNPKLVWMLRLAGASTPDAYESVGKMVVVFEKKSTIWEICQDPQVMRALSRAWTPREHNLLPKTVRDAIKSFLLVSRRMGFYGPSMHRIIELAIQNWMQDTF